MSKQFYQILIENRAIIITSFGITWGILYKYPAYASFKVAVLVTLFFFIAFIFLKYLISRRIFTWVGKKGEMLKIVRLSNKSYCSTIGILLAFYLSTSINIINKVSQTECINNTELNINNSGENITQGQLATEWLYNEIAKNDLFYYQNIHDNNVTIVIVYYQPYIHLPYSLLSKMDVWVYSDIDCIVICQVIVLQAISQPQERCTCVFL